MTTTVCPADNPRDDACFQLIQRMIGDMKIRHLSPSTIESYARHVAKFSQFMAKPLSRATAEDIRLFQLDILEQLQSSSL